MSEFVFVLDSMLKIMLIVGAVVFCSYVTWLKHIYAEAINTLGEFYKNLSDEENTEKEDEPT